MTENKVIPEKQMQNLLICLCNKAVGIHAFYLCYFMWYVRSPHCSPAWTPSSRNLKPSNYQWKNFIKHSEFDLSAILFKQDLNTLKNQGYQVKLINCYKVKLINVLHTKKSWPCICNFMAYSFPHSSFLVQLYCFADTEYLLFPSVLGLLITLPTLPFPNIPCPSSHKTISLFFCIMMGNTLS